MRVCGNILLVLLLIVGTLATVDAQPPRKKRTPPWHIEPTAETLRKVDQLIESIRDAETTMHVAPRRSRILRTKRPVLRISITDPSVVDIIQYSPMEFEIIGGRPGLTTMTIWFAPDKNADPQSADARDGHKPSRTAVTILHGARRGN